MKSVPLQHSLLLDYVCTNLPIIICSRTYKLIGGKQKTERCRDMQDLYGG